MVITKTINRRLEEIQKEDDKILQKIRPKIDKINEDARMKCRELLEKEGLDPDKYGFSETSYCYPVLPLSRGRYTYCRNRNDIISDILLKIELDEIPKKEVKSYVDNYEIEFKD